MKENYAVMCPKCKEVINITEVYKEFNSQQPEVIACQGEGESADMNLSKYSESGTSEEYPSADNKDVEEKK